MYKMSFTHLLIHLHKHSIKTSHYCSKVVLCSEWFPSKFGSFCTELFPILILHAINEGKFVSWFVNKIRQVCKEWGAELVRSVNQSFKIYIMFPPRASFLRFMQLVLSQKASLPRIINWFLRDIYKSLFCISDVQGYILGYIYGKSILINKLILFGSVWSAYTFFSGISRALLKRVPRSSGQTHYHLTSCCCEHEYK